MRAASRIALFLAAAAATAVLPSAAAEGPELPSISGQASASFSAWEDRGSALLPVGAAAAYAGSALCELRAEAPASAPAEPGDASRCAFEGALSADAASGALSFALRELWAEWRPLPAVALRAGRQRLGFGSGFGWNPSNDLDPRRDPSDPSAPRTGTDAAQLRLDAGTAAGFPLSLSIEAMPPPFAPGIDLEDSLYAAQLYAYAGEVELMAVASASRLGGPDSRWLVGGWATLPIGRLVLGLEGAARRRADRFRPGPDGLPVADEGVYGAVAATATLRAGDFVAVAEASWDQASYSRGELDSILAPAALPAWAAIGEAASLAAPGAVGPLHCLARLSWASGDLSASCGAIVDAASGALVASAELAATTGGRATARLRASAPAGPVGEDELGLSGRGWSAGASISVCY